MCEYGLEVLRIHTGIIASPLFKVNIEVSREGVGFFTEVSRAEPNDKVELREVFRPSSLSLSQ